MFLARQQSCVVVDGEDFVRLLFDYLLSNEKALLEKTLRLTLNPSCLRYINTKLRKIGQRSSQNFLNTFKNKPLSPSELLDLKTLLENLCSLQIEPPQNVLEKEILEIDLTLFKDLRVFELTGYSPASLVNLDYETVKLEVIVIRGGTGKHSMTSFRQLLGPTRPFLEKCITSGIWRYLQVLDCSYNQIDKLDESLVRRYHFIFFFLSLCRTRKLVKDGQSHVATKHLLD
eukprot:TRINITY_DN8334_c0_g1_i2.p1 TRINITY_DN8334_c0_g1~~TRINITY_DN8334_c0_g1_i2.p1  ORF type:complete len:230 (+),score=37.43 TRINITY_DN8334_c0_g1_i2:111-800(+)